MSRTLKGALTGVGGVLVATSAWAVPAPALTGSPDGPALPILAGALASQRTLPAPDQRSAPLLVLIQTDDRRELEDRRRALEDERRQLEDQRRQLEDARRQLEQDLASVPPSADAVVDDRHAAVEARHEEESAALQEQRAAEDEARRAARTDRAEEENRQIAEERRREDEERARRNTERALQEEREVVERRRKEDEERAAALDAELSAISEAITSELQAHSSQLQQQSQEISAREDEVLRGMLALEEELSTINRQLSDALPQPTDDEMMATETPASEPADPSSLERGAPATTDDAATPTRQGDEAAAAATAAEAAVSESDVPATEEAGEANAVAVQPQRDIQRILAQPDEPIMVGGVPLEDDIRVYVATENVNMRATPNLDARRLGTIAGGTRVIVVSEQEGWYGIRLIGGDVGYISAPFLLPYQP